MMAWFKVKRHDKDEKYFIKNGGIFLEELIALSNGRSNPIHHFSANELLRATNNYDSHQIFASDYDYQLYKGSLNDRPIFVKKYGKFGFLKNYPAMPYKDIAMGSQMCIHKNVLKVIGYCLETEIPTIVYECARTKFLSECIFATDVEPLPWKCRLKIATDLANAVAYLHTAFSRPIIHRDIRSKTIILDENNVPKLIDFGLCISIPEGQSHIKDALRGRTLLIAPEYLGRGYITEKADVYSFGLLLLELLTGQRLINFYVEELSNVVDPTITNEGIKLEKLLDFGTLLVRCISDDEQNRPTMTNVAKELRRIYQSFSLPC